MYLTTNNNEDNRENSSLYEEGYEGMNLSKLNLCDEGKDRSFLYLYIFATIVMLPHLRSSC